MRLHIIYNLISLQKKFNKGKEHVLIVLKMSIYQTTEHYAETREMISKRITQCDWLISRLLLCDNNR